MTENLTTRDVFQQVDTRLGRVEVDVRDLRGEIILQKTLKLSTLTAL